MREFMALSSLITLVMTTAPAVTSLIIRIDSMMTSFGLSRFTTVLLAYSLHLISACFAPFLLAPISETRGRYPLVIGCQVSNALLVLAQPFGNSTVPLAVSCALQGAACSLCVSMSGGILVDRYGAHERYMKLALLSTTMVSAQDLGPVRCFLLFIFETMPEPGKSSSAAFLSNGEATEPSHSLS